MDGHAKAAKIKGEEKCIPSQNTAKCTTLTFLLWGSEVSCAFLCHRCYFSFLSPWPLHSKSCCQCSWRDQRCQHGHSAPKYSGRCTFAAGEFTDSGVRRISECCWCHSPESTQVSRTEANSEVPWLEIPAQYKGKSLLFLLFTLNGSIS